jgi:hypothetical protein
MRFTPLTADLWNVLTAPETESPPSGEGAISILIVDAIILFCTFAHPPPARYRIALGNAACPESYDEKLRKCQCFAHQLRSLLLRRSKAETEEVSGKAHLESETLLPGGRRRQSSMRRTPFIRIAILRRMYICLGTSISSHHKKIFLSTVNYLIS